MSGEAPARPRAINTGRTQTAANDQGDSHAIAIPGSVPNQSFTTSWYSSTPPIAIASSRVSLCVYYLTVTSLAVKQQLVSSPFKSTDHCHLPQLPAVSRGLCKCHGHMPSTFYCCWLFQGAEADSSPAPGLSRSVAWGGGSFIAGHSAFGRHGAHSGGIAPSSASSRLSLDTPAGVLQPDRLQMVLSSHVCASSLLQPTSAVATAAPRA